MSLDPKITKYYADLYREYHATHHKALTGKLTAPYVKAIGELVDAQRASYPRLLDYGSGKGYQYLADRVQEQWHDFLPVCYDPGVRQLSRRPEGTFHGVICTDVLEHIEEEHLPEVLRDIFAYANADGEPFVFLAICCRPACKQFADGRNFHFTVKPSDWWRELINPLKPPHVKLVMEFLEVPEVPNGDAERTGDLASGE